MKSACKSVSRSNQQALHVQLDCGRSRQIYQMPVENRANLIPEVVVKGATGRDFHSFNIVFRHDARFEMGTAGLDGHYVVLADNVWWRHRFDV